MKNRKNNNKILIIISVLTLIVAILGATFAYFSASVVSNNVINANAATFSLAYVDNLDGIKTKLIPATDEIALYTGTNKQWINKEEFTTINEDNQEITIKGQGECYDDYKNEVCSVYSFTFGNSSFTTSMDVSAKITVSVNQMENLWIAVYDETNTQVVAPAKVPHLTGGEVILGGIEQYLLASSKDVGNLKFDAKDPTTYTPIVDKSDPANKDLDTNVRTYKIVMWVKELGIDQTKADANKIFIGSITVETANGGVTATFSTSQK